MGRRKSKGNCKVLSGYLSYSKFGSPFDDTVAVPFIVNIWSAICGTVFCKFMSSAIIAVVARYHFAGTGIKIINISVDLHNTTLKFSGISRIIPGAVLLDPASSH